MYVTFRKKKDSEKYFQILDFTDKKKFGKLIDYLIGIIFYTSILCSKKTQCCSKAILISYF